MSRLSIITQNKAQATVEELYKDVERRLSASPSGLCPVDVASSFLKMCHAQSCGKCVPCRIGLGQLEKLLDDVLDGNATLDTIDLIEKTAESIYFSADCAIGYEAANMVLKGIRGFRDDFVEHIEHGRCKCALNQPVPCVAQCPAGVDIPGYISLVEAGRNADAVRLIRKDNPLPAVCGLICEHPCEVRCRRSMMDASINIRGLKRFAVEHAGSVPVPKPLPPTGKKVARTSRSTTSSAFFTLSAISALESFTYFSTVFPFLSTYVVLTLLSLSPKATFSKTLRCGKSAYFWKTVFTGLWLGGRLLMSWPWRRIFPLVGISKPAIMRRVVVFPQPEGPRKVTNSPLRTYRFILSMTLTPSNSLQTSTSSIILVAFFSISVLQKQCGFY